MTSSFAKKQFFGTWFFFFLALPLWDVATPACAKTIFQALKNYFFRNACGRKWNTMPKFKMSFLALPFVESGTKVANPLCLRKTNGQMNLTKKTNFQVPKNCLFVFFRFSVLIDPWWNEIVLCEKTIFWNPKNCFFNTCLHSLQPSQNHSKSIFGNLNNCFAPITW